MTLEVRVPFYTSRQMDDLSHEELQDWLLLLNRAQREYCARVNGRARSMLNANYSLNRWLTEESKGRSVRPSLRASGIQKNMKVLF